MFYVLLDWLLLEVCCFLNKIEKWQLSSKGVSRFVCVRACLGVGLFGRWVVCMFLRLSVLFVGAFGRLFVGIFIFSKVRVA